MVIAACSPLLKDRSDQLSLRKFVSELKFSRGSSPWLYGGMKHKASAPDVHVTHSFYQRGNRSVHMDLVSYLVNMSIKHVFIRLFAAACL